MVAFVKNDFETVLDFFYCYGYGANAFEAVQRIATDKKDYCRCSLYVIV